MGFHPNGEQRDASGRGGRVGAAVVFADRVFGHAGFPGEPGGGEARGGGELFQAAAEAAGDGVPHGSRLAGAFSSHDSGSKWQLEHGGRGLRRDWRLGLGGTGCGTSRAESTLYAGLQVGTRKAVDAGSSALCATKRRFLFTTT